MGSLLVIGYWLLVIGYWLLVIGYWLLVIGNSNMKSTFRNNGIMYTIGLSVFSCEEKVFKCCTFLGGLGGSA
jgi:uncharacterized membrane protein